MSYTSEEIVKRDAESLYIGNLNTVESDLVLPVKGNLGSDITWKSGHERFLSSTGKVERPKYGMHDRKISLDATLTYEDATFTRRFMVKVLQLPNTLKVSHVYPVEATGQPDEWIMLPGAAIVVKDDGDIISHSVTWKEDQVCFEKEGIYEVTGSLADTRIPVTAKIQVEYIVSDTPASMVSDTSERRKFWQLWFEPDYVKFAEGPFLSSQERQRRHLLSINDDQMLINHRIAAGLDTKNAPFMDGWDAPNSQIKGHTTGHYLSALALCYRATKDEDIRKKAVYMTESLKECQDAFRIAEAGFLAGYSEDQFDKLEHYVPYPEIWAPYYTMHKLLAGLLDIYEYLGIDLALEVAEKLGTWTYNRLSKLPAKQLKKMWSMYIAGEFGGMNEAVARLYGYTGDERHLACAKFFDNDKLFYPLSKYTDALSGMHANQHIPQILGAVQIYKATGDEKYLRIAKHFWKSVVEGRIYVNGGVGEGEMFHTRYETGNLLTEHTTESCATYNMLKLTRELYKLDPKPEYMDYYERATLNHILANQDENGSGNTTYFFPMNPGARRYFEVENHCCHGTGLESPFRYQEGIAFLKGREDGTYTLYVNLYTPCEIDFSDQGIHVEIKNIAEGNDKFFLHVAAEGEKLWNVKVRPPYWAQLGDNDMQRRIKECVDGKQKVQIDVYAEWVYSFRIERAKDREDLGAICYGPYVLGLLSDEKDFIILDVSQETLNQKMKIHSMEEFEYEGMRFCPLYLVKDRAYHTYLKLQVPGEKTGDKYK